MPDGPVVFGPFRLDPSAGRLSAGERSVPLRRRTWEVLCHLVARAGELVSKQELLAAVWRDAVVSEATLATSIAELRRALGDDPRRPRFIETVHRRGFRFVARVAPASPSEHAPPPLGRGREMEALRTWWREADGGRRRLGFVTGEVGMGKTTLVRAFAEGLAGDRVRVATGACIEHHGEGEAFMPVLDAVRRLARGPEGAEVARRIRAAAPPWLGGLLGVGEAEGGGAGGAEPPSTRLETLRCLAETLEGLAADAPLLLVLEDLHWSDGSTLDLLGLLARRHEPARLMVLATLRVDDARSAGHPAAERTQSLAREPCGGTVALPGLAAADAAALLAGCMGGGEVPAELAADLTARTGGNPFFLREMAQHLVRLGALARRDGAWRLRDPAAAAVPPEGVLAVLEPRIARLDERAQRTLEAAAVVGERFPPRLVAEALGGAADEETVDATCSELAARGELVARDEEGFRFLHALGASALRRRIPASRRRRLHERIGRALERGGGASAALLARHFAEAGDPERALVHYEEAVAAAKQRFASHEVALLCRAALEQLAGLPAGRPRAERELRLQLERGSATLATRGYSAPEQAAIFGRVCELAEVLDQPAVRFLGAGGLFFHHLSSGNVPAGRAAAERMLARTEGLPEPMRDAARIGMGVALYNAGELDRALACLERDGPAPVGPGVTPVDVHVFRLAALANTYAHVGRPARARATIEACVARGASGGRPFDLANGHRMAAELYAILGEAGRARAHAERAAAVADPHAFAQLLAIARLFEGWARAQAGEGADEAARGLAAIQDALAALEPTGYRLTMSAFRLRQAEAALRAGAPDAADEAVEAGLAYVEESGEHRHESDLLRLRGRVRLRAAGPGAEEAAARCFRAACRVARAQGATLLELRALAEWAALPGRPEAVAALRARLEEHPGALPAHELEKARRQVA